LASAAQAQCQGRDQANDIHFALSLDDLQLASELDNPPWRNDAGDFPP
jgi:hypothetical protein